jgi:hypothetical protein
VTAPIRWDEEASTLALHSTNATYLVRCPRCETAATVERLERAKARFTCTSCGLSKRCEEQNWSRSYSREPRDPFFGFALWLQTSCCGELLWAYNRAHLEFLRQYVTASLREREPNHNSSAASRLPRWLKAAANRDEIVRCIERLMTA